MDAEKTVRQSEAARLFVQLVRNGYFKESCLRVSEAVRFVNTPDSTFRDMIKNKQIEEECIQRLPNGTIRIRMHELARLHSGMFSSRQLKLFPPLPPFAGLPENQNN